MTEKEKDPFKNAALLDSCLHVFGAALSLVTGMNQQGAFVPASIQSIRMWRELPSQAWSHVKINANGDGNAALVSIRVFDDEGEILVEFENLELRRMLTLSTVRQTSAPAKGNGKPPHNDIFQSRDQFIQLLHPMNRKERVATIGKWLTSEITDTMGQAADGLNLDKLPASTAFLEIGLDSLLVTELQRRIQEKLEFRFKPMQGLDYQSIESLAEFIHDEVLKFSLEAELVKAVN